MPDRDIDLLDGAWWSHEPHEAWTWMRQHAPVYHDAKNDVWAITRFEDVLAIEKDPKTFSSRRSPRPHGDPLPMMISMDNPAHQRRRSLVNRGFTPRRVADHESAIREICTDIIDRVCERGECDFVWDIAAPLPLLLIADMLGFERDAYDDLLRWSDDLIRGTTATDEEASTKAMEAALEFRHYQLGVIADRRSKPPQSDLVSLLCHAEIDGERLDDESLIQETLLILIGGDETTRHVITGGMLALMEHPDQRALMTDAANDGDGDALETAVEELLRWSDDMVSSLSGSATEEQILRSFQAMEGYTAFCTHAVAERRATPTDDLMSVLVHAEVDGDRLSPDDVLHESLLILVGGDETTRHVITGGMEQLLLHPDQRKLLVEDLGKLTVAVEEMLRWVTPIKSMCRTVTRDVEFMGQAMTAGQKCLLLFESANFDAAKFRDPFRFDVERQPNEHVAFGFGSHYCLGQALARLELKVMFEQLLTRMPDIELAADPASLPRRRANFITGLEAMPITFSPSKPLERASV